MPSLGNLNVEIGANLQPLEAGLNKAKSQLSDFGRTATTNLNGADASLKNLYQHLDNLTASLAKTRFGTAQFKELETEITKTTLRIEGLEAAELGAAKAGQALAVSNAEVAASSRTLGGGLNVLKDGFGLIRQAAYLLPGIGIAGIFNVIFEGVTKAADALGIFVSANEEAEKATNDYNESLKKISETQNSNTQSELAHANVLLAIARDNSAALNLRKNAVQELQNLYPSYLGNLTQEQILTGNITTQVNALTDALIAKGLAEASEKKFAESSTRILDLIDARRIAVGKLITAQADLDRVNKAGSGFSNPNATNLTQDIYAKKLRDATSALKEVDTQLHVAQFDQANFLNDVVKFGEQAGELYVKPVKPLKEVVESTKKAKKEVNELKDDLLNLYNLKGAVQAPGAPETKTPLVPLIGQGDATNNRVSNNLEKSKTELIAQATQAAGEIQKTFDNLISNVIGSFGESLGAALAGKTDPFQALKQTLSSGIKALGESLIRLGALALPIQKALKNLLTTPAGPFIVIGAGIALEALAGAITSKGVTPHAEGGVFTGPTQIGSHLFGEAGPEFLVGQNKLQQLLQETGARSNHVTVDGNISLGYNEIKIALSRADRYRGRNYGPGNG